MIDTIQAAGFNTIRIPVSWHNHVDDNFQISEAWMNRVQEVVDYAYNNDMYVIINIHHDTMVGYYYPSSDNYDTSEKYITTIWTQIAERFADYGDKLIYESINEPRLVGTNYEWWIDTSKEECLDAVDCINRLNQVFVDTVRGTGGNNPTRYLMVPGYAASPSFEVIDQFVFPTDISTNVNKIILSTHAYTPYNFALQASTEADAVSDFSVDNKARTKDITGFMTQLYNKFISKGIPVVIGEFGARDKDGNLQDRVDYSAFYIATAKSFGITCVWWDNNSFAGTGENFGLLKRDTLTLEYPDLIVALMKYAE
jgi:endoglucanase